MSADERRYRLYVEMQRHRRGTGVYRLISDEASTLTHAEACTVRSKHSDPASILLVEADSAAERALTIYGLPGRTLTQSRGSLTTAKRAFMRSAMMRFARLSSSWGG